MGCIVCRNLRIENVDGAGPSTSDLSARQSAGDMSKRKSRLEVPAASFDGGRKMQRVSSSKTREVVAHLLPSVRGRECRPGVRVSMADGDFPPETRTLYLEKDKKGNTFVNQYVIVRDLGSGSFGKVKLCLNTMDKKLYAVKAIDKKRLRLRGTRLTRPGVTAPDPLEPVLKEVAIMKRLRHPNIVRLHEVIDDPLGQFFFIVLDYVEMGSISGADGFEQQAEPLALHTFRDVCTGLDYLHKHHIVHRDLKPENLLMSAEGVVKLSDFGVSEMFDNEEGDSMNRTAGTPAFLAPEVVSGGEYRGQPADIWSLGVCLYVLLFGSVPFKGANLVQVYESIKNDALTFPPAAPAAAGCAAPVSMLARDLIKMILVKDPAARPTLQEIMQHPWTTSGGRRPLPSYVKGAVPAGAGEGADGADAEEETAVNVDAVSKELSKQRGIDAVSFEAGEHLFTQGEDADSMYYIQSGECVCLYDRAIEAAGCSDGGSTDEDEAGVDDLGDVPERDESLDSSWHRTHRSSLIRARSFSARGGAAEEPGWGQPAVLGTFGPGEFLGGLDPREARRTCTARAQQPVSALRIEGEALGLLNSQPEVAERLRRLAAERRAKLEAVLAVDRIKFGSLRGSMQQRTAALLPSAAGS